MARIWNRKYLNRGHGILSRLIDSQLLPSITLLAD